MADFRKLGVGLQGMGAWFSGQGPQWEQQQYLQREREKQMAMYRQEQASAARGDRSVNAALAIRAVGEQLDAGNVDRAVTILNESMLGSMGTPVQNVASPLKQLIAGGRIDDAKNAIKLLDQEFTTRLGLPQRAAPEPLTSNQVINGQVVRPTAEGGYAATQVEGFQAPIDEAGMREDQNGILRYTTGPERGQPVFPDVITAAESISDKDYNSMASGFRNEIYRANADFYKLAASWDRISAGVDGPSPVGDLALIYNFMKMLDPGSTVMQGEIASAQNTTGAAGQIYGIYNKIASGEDLLPEQRADFYRQAQSIYNSAKARAQQVEEQFASMAERRNIRREDVLVDRGSDPDISSALPGNAPRVINSQAEFDALQPGEEYIEIINGRPYRAVK